MRDWLWAMTPVVILAAALGGTQLHNTDLAHHLAVGRAIADTGGIPADYPWSPNALPGTSSWNGEWLFRLIAHALWTTGGAPALCLWRGLWLAVIGALVLQLARDPDRPPGPAATFAALAALALAAFRLSMLRPELASYTGALLLAGRAMTLERRPWRTADGALLVAVTAAWANLHNLWPLAWLIAVPLALRHRQWRWIPPILAAPLLTPNPLASITFPFALGAKIAGPWGDYFRAFTGYATPLDPRTWRAHFVLAFWLLPVLAAARHRRSVTALYLLALTLALGTRMIRLTAFALLLAPPLLARGLPARPRLRLPGRVAALALALVLATGWIRGDWPIHAGLDGRWAPTDRARITLAPAIDALPANAPVFNNPNAGGALQLAGRPAFVDNNPQAFDADTFLPRLARVLRGQEAIQPWLREQQIDAALIAYRGNQLWRLIASLHADPDWRLVHADDHAVVFRRQPPPDSHRGDQQSQLEQRDRMLRQLREPDIAPRPSRLRDPVPSRERARLYTALQLHALAVGEYLNAIAASPSDPGLRVSLARNLIALERGADARKVLERAIALASDDPRVVRLREELTR